MAEPAIKKVKYIQKIWFLVWLLGFKI